MMRLLIFCCISAKVIADDDQTFIAALFIRRENRRLAGRAVARIDSSSVMSCCQACLRHSWCTSSNFEEVLRSCELNKHEVSLINYDGELTEQKGTTFTMLLKKHCVASCDEITEVNGCCRNNPCQNGGTCTEICELKSVRYNCSCPANFMGRHCEFKRKSCQAYKAAGERKSGLYTITDDRNQSFQVFCDFDSEPGFAWNLIQSFSLSQKQNILFSDYTEAVSGDHPNWRAYLIRRNYLEWLGTQSTHWRATCRYDTDGVVYTDYMRTSLANCNILTLPTNFYGQCFQFEFINIRGHECVDCTVPLWQGKGDYPLHTDTYSQHECEFNGKQGALISEDNFGFYGAVNSQHRCSNNSLSTTQFWLGGQ